MTLAQSSETSSTAKTDAVKPYTEKEETASRARIESFEKKINANKDNDKVDYEAELKRLNEMKARFNERAKTKFDMKEEK